MSQTGRGAVGEMLHTLVGNKRLIVGVETSFGVATLGIGVLVVDGEPRDESGNETVLATAHRTRDGDSVSDTPGRVPPCAYPHYAGEGIFVEPTGLTE